MSGEVLCAAAHNGSERTCERRMELVARAVAHEALRPVLAALGQREAPGAAERLELVRELFALEGP
jgi:hypothetical protein